jgi:hypothetical protein
MSDAPPLSGTHASIDSVAIPALTFPVTVSGLSSGGYMAVQVHVALSDRVSGAGVIAAGPYHCADGSVRNALARCILAADLDIAPLLAFATESAASGHIAPVDNLRNAKAWVFHSARDQVVGHQIAVGLVEFYAAFMPADHIRLVDDVDAAHGWPTLTEGRECLEMGGEFINACGYDAAGNLLNHLYTDLGTRTTGTAGRDLTDIDLSAYFEPGSGIAEAGYLFVPSECRPISEACRLHISFHGCRQGAEFIGDSFAIKAGLNEWASSNRIVIVYPQIQSSVLNPQGCWDWWGYTGADYDQRSGKQVAGVSAIIDAFAKQQLY